MDYIGFNGSATSFNLLADLRFKDADGSHYVGFQAPSAVGANLVWTLPASDGSANRVLKTDGSGNLNFAEITNAYIASNAAIAGTKISPDFGSQNITTTGALDIGANAAIFGTLTISNASPTLIFTEDDANPDFKLEANSGQFKIIDSTNSADRLVLNTDGHIDIAGNVDFGAGVDVTGNITVTGTVDGVDIATRDTLFGGLTSSSGVLTDGVSATTQTSSDNTTKVATTAYVTTAVNNLINGAPAALDTLNELAAAMNDDAAFSTTVTNSLATKLALAGGQMTGNITFSGSQTVDGRDLSVDGAKLDGGIMLADGDKGDITVGSSGTSWTIDSGAVTTAKIADDAIDADKLASNSVVSASIVDGTIVNADINASAAIAGSKISPDFGSQNIVTTGSITGNDLEIDSGTLSIDASNNRVGVGTTSPTDLLDIHTTTNNQRLLRLSHPSSPTTACAFIGYNTDGTGTTNNIVTFGIQTSDTYYNVLNIRRSTQTVGINKLIPTEALDVTGNIAVSGTVDGVDIATRDTLFGGLTSSSGVLTNGVTATTATTGDNTTKVATTAFIQTALSNYIATGSNIQNSAISTAKIADDAVTTAKIADDAITTAKLAADAVTASELSNNIVDDNKLTSNAVTTAKIADEAVTLAKLEHGTSSNNGKFLRANNGADPTFETVDTSVADGSITTAKIADDAVTADKLASNSVVSDSIVDGAIVNADINASAAIAGSKISPAFGSQAISTTGNLGCADITIGDVSPAINFNDSDENPNYQIRLNGGILKFTDTTNSAERIQINSDGHVDILGNLDVGAGIDVTGNVASSGTIAANGGSIFVTGTSPAVFFTDTDDNPDYYLQDQNGTFRLVDNTNSTELLTANATTLVSKVNHDFSAGIDVTGAITGTGDMTIDTSTFKVDSSNNRVGIGTTAPTDLLDIHTATNNQRLLRLSHPSSPTGACAFIGYNDDGTGTTNNIVTFGIQTSSNYYNVLNIRRSTQTVGINKLIPTEALDVTGNIAVSGTAEVGGGILNVKNTGSQSVVRFYCESSNAHYAEVQAPAHSVFSGNVTLTLPAAAGNQSLVGTTETQTLTNKTLTSAVLNTGVSGTAILDEDNMASNSATQLATQQSIKAYVDANAGGGGTSPGGSNTQVQFNNSGSFGGSSNLTFDGTNLTVGGTITATSAASSANGIRKITASTSAPSGGSDGDVWIKYTA